MTAPPPIWLNGRLLPGDQPQISAFDRGFTLGDGAFETLRARGRQPLWLDDHLARLRRSADLLGIPMPLDDDAVAEGLGSLLAAYGYAESALRLTVSRGPSERRGLWPSDDPAKPTLLATIAPLPPAREALRLVITEVTRRNEQSPLSRIKALTYGDNLLARRDAARRGVDDALMLNGQGRIACASAANLFLRIDGRWRTPPVSDGALPGLARRRLLPLLDAAETPLTPQDLLRADAAFLSNSLGLGGIREIDGRPLEDPAALLATLSLFGSG